MPKLSLLLFLAVPFVSSAQDCEPSAQVREALGRPSGFRAVRELFPDDVWAHRAYQDTFRQGPVYRQQVIDEYRDLLAKHPGDKAYLYLYGRTLVGTRTPTAIEEFDRALAQDPAYTLAHSALAEIYHSTNFKDPGKTRTHLEAWMDACPTQLPAFHYLERMENSDFLRRQVARLRPLLESRSDAVAIGHYHLLWTLEFQAHAPTEYPQMREGIRKDLAKLRGMDLGKYPQLASTLREGYKLVDDKDALQWLDEQAPAKLSASSNAAMEAYQGWQKAHPFAVTKPGEKYPMEAHNARNKALLDATAEWIQKWPDDSFTWSQRLTAVQMNRETSDAEAERAAEGLLRTTQAFSTGSSHRFQVASLYLQRNMHLNEIPEMINHGLKELDKPAPPVFASDLYPQPSGMNAQSMRLMSMLQGLNTLVDYYLKTYQPDKALASLADIRKALDANKLADSATDYDKQNWTRNDGMYWQKMGQLAENQGRKLDALTFYQNEIRGQSFLGNQDYVKRTAKTLWTDIGGTDAAWEAWLAGIAPPKPITVAAVRTDWEKMNKPLPEFELTDVTGKTWHLADLKGKTTLINLWATWCGPCQMELPYLQKLYDKLKNRPDIRIITLNTDDNPGMIDAFLKDKKYTFPILPARAYVDKLVPYLSIPRNWIVDTEAVVKLEGIGFSGDADTWVEKMTEKMTQAKQ